MRDRIILLLLIITPLFLSLPRVKNADYQEPSQIELRLIRGLGFGLGGQIQGRFSLNASGPDSLDRVEFYIDDQLIGEDSSQPFSISFSTGDYETGVHQFSAVGYPADGRELTSNRISRQFVSVISVGLVVAAIIILVVVLRFASSYIARSKNPGAQKGFGYLGGTVCKNCGRSFGIHWWSLRLGLGRMDRCPHCGKWNMVNRASAETLAQAEHAERESEPAESPVAEQQSKDDDILRRQIDESRYRDE
jgi:hypothetical protein